MHTHAPMVPVQTARALFLSLQGLTADCSRPCSPRALAEEIERLGFVQLDSINVVERAHHHILGTRFRAYKPEMLDALHRRGALFEHITHDASLIPSQWFRHWHHRFLKTPSSAWFRQQLGPKPRQVLREVRRRIEVEGPLMARDFDDPQGRAGTWWQWKPAKAALEFLWRAGELAVAERRNFHKVYDLSERVIPQKHYEPRSTQTELVAWACSSALTRLGVATPREIAGYWRAVSLSAVQQWLRAALRSGAAVPVLREAVDGTKIRAVALASWEQEASRVSPANPAMRLLSPFDPAIRDRRRCLELFGFHYRFEAFVPEPKRQYGYYVLPILWGDKLVGRLDPKLDRKTGTLTVLGLWWEPRVPASDQRKRALNDALNAYSQLIGAKRWMAPKGLL